MEYNYGKIWVVGASGRIGSMIHNMLDIRHSELFETDSEELDITDAKAVNLFGSRNRPNTIINCAGIADSQFCEEHMEEAYKVNALGVRNLSAIARKIDARIIQISTDDIFCDVTETAHHEFDAPNPTNVYGKSKLAGENFVKELAPKHLILRSSWVYAKDGKNFVNYILRCAEEGKTVEAPIDDFACPTSAKELTRVLLRLIEAEQEGIYHAVCRGYCSRYELAQEIFRLLGKDESLVIPVKLYGEAGPRYTILDDMMLRMCEMERPVTWKEALAEYIEDYKKTI